MTIACLGWGSLIWEPKTLPVEPADWLTDGPELPVEFSRLSEGNRITLVIRETGPTVPVLWCALPCETVEQAAELLRRREGKTKHEWIGRWPNASGTAFLHQATIETWARTKDELTGVVWTAIPPKWSAVNGRVPSLNEMICHLRSLGPEGRQDAFEYIERAPLQIQTPHRAALAEAVRALR
jgi:hypothetical protein